MGDALVALIAAIVGFGWMAFLPTVGLLWLLGWLN